MSYDAKLKQKRDWERVLSTAIRQGIDAGIAQECVKAEAEKVALQRDFVRNLINQTAFSDKEIASIAEIAEVLVTELRQELNK